MSASLVGSEMCIRDSSEAMRSSEAARAARGAPPERSTPPSPSSPRGGMAVSYTHLTLPTICSV
eukprot:9794872-Alexandrium_andersonii.AAC.1